MRGGGACGTNQVGPQLRDQEFVGAH
jgi:hypothetical protein